MKKLITAACLFLTSTSFATLQDCPLIHGTYDCGLSGPVKIAKRKDSSQYTIFVDAPTGGVALFPTLVVIPDNKKKPEASKEVVGITKVTKSVCVTEGGRKILRQREVSTNGIPDVGIYELRWSEDFPDNIEYSRTSKLLGPTYHVCTKIQ